jgi:hypothetical protein
LAYYVDISAEFSGAWCEDEFIISVTGKEPVRQLGKLYDSICINDAAIWLGGGNSNPFDRGGLCLAVYSELKPEIIKAWEEAYVDNQKLKEAVLALSKSLRMRVSVILLCRPNGCQRSNVTAVSIQWCSGSTRGSRTFTTSAGS